MEWYTSRLGRKILKIKSLLLLLYIYEFIIEYRKSSIGIIRK